MHAVCHGFGPHDAGRQRRRADGAPAIRAGDGRLAMSTVELELQVQKLSEQVAIQAEAITKLVELVSNLDGVDAAPVKPYAMRLKTVHSDANAAPKAEAPSIDQQATEPTAASPDQ